MASMGASQMTVVAMFLVVTFLFLSSCPVLSSQTGFLITPSSQVVPIGDAATYECQHNSSDFLYWKVNNTLVESSPPLGISLSTYRQGNSIVHVLTISGLPEYNETVVECIAGFFDGTFETSPPALLQVFSAYTTTSSYDNGFVVTPMDLSVAVGTTATFNCYHSSADIIGWRVNGTGLGAFHPESVTVIGQVADGIYRQVLMIDALPAYNGTTIQCLALFFHDSMTQMSPEVTLTIQGPLDPVLNILLTSSSSAIMLFWIPPFSLKLSNTEPAIAYCVDIWKTTCDETFHVLSDCSVTQPHYNYTAPHSLTPLDMFRFVITPRSNVMGAINGTPSEPVIGEFSTSVSVKTNVEYEPVLNANIIFPILRCAIGSYVIILRSVDDGPGLEPLNSNCSMAGNGMGSNQVEVTLDYCELEKRRLCQCDLFHEMPNRKLIPIASDFELSTHDIQNVKVTVPASSKIITLNYTYIDGSTSRGVLFIIHTKEVFHYFVFDRETDQVPKMIDGLIAENYTVTVFVIDERGIPLSRSASHPRFVTTTKDSNSLMCQGPPSPVNATIRRANSNSHRRSVQCTFSDMKFSGCVVLVHSVAIHNSSLYDLVDASVYYAERMGEMASVEINIGGDGDSVAVFAYNNETGMIDKHPVYMIPMSEFSVPCSEENNIVTVTVVVIVNLIVICGISIFTTTVVVIIKKIRREGITKKKEKQIFASGTKLCCTMSMEEECVPKTTQVELVLNTPTKIWQRPTTNFTRVCDDLDTSLTRLCSATATEELVLRNETSKVNVYTGYQENNDEDPSRSLYVTQNFESDCHIRNRYSKERSSLFRDPVLVESFSVLVEEHKCTKPHLWLPSIGSCRTARKAQYLEGTSNGEMSEKLILQDSAYQDRGIFSILCTHFTGK